MTATPPTFTSQHVGQAVRQLREVNHNPATVNAINKAFGNLKPGRCRWQYDGEKLLIESASDKRKEYLVTQIGCECPAAMALRTCWHVWAFRILQAAQGMTVRRLPRFTVDDLYN